VKNHRTVLRPLSLLITEHSRDGLLLRVLQTLPIRQSAFIRKSTIALLETLRGKLICEAMAFRIGQGGFFEASSGFPGLQRRIVSFSEL
jgi:hypothetical protein